MQHSTSEMSTVPSDLTPIPQPPHLLEKGEWQDGWMTSRFPLDSVFQLHWYLRIQGIHNPAGNRTSSHVVVHEEGRRNWKGANVNTHSRPDHEGLCMPTRVRENANHIFSLTLVTCFLTAFGLG